MKNQRTVLVHLPRINIKEAFKTKAIIEKLIVKMPMKIHNLEVGMGDKGKWVCGFAIYDPTEQQIAEVVGWLCDYGFGIPKLYELGG
jgi:hypothetical protein